MFKCTKIKVAKTMLHYWEEPCISGKEGSGAVFFSGCNLHCVHCQNKDISGGKAGRYLLIPELSEELLKLQEMGANNINLVTPSHYYLQIKEALEPIKDHLHIPVIANTSSYDKVEILKQMEGYIDIFLADYKYDTSEVADRYSHAPDYPEVAREALKEMFRQVGPCTFDERGMLKKGMVVRVLALPSHIREAKACVKRVYEMFGDDVYISVMSQYTPFRIPEGYEEIDRKLTKREYERLLSYTFDLGVTNAFLQEGEVAMESFIPDFLSNENF